MACESARRCGELRRHARAAAAASGLQSKPRPLAHRALRAPKAAHVADLQQLAHRARANANGRRRTCAAARRRTAVARAALFRHRLPDHHHAQPRAHEPHGMLLRRERFESRADRPSSNGPVIKESSGSHSRDEAWRGRAGRASSDGTMHRAHGTRGVGEGTRRRRACATARLAAGRAETPQPPSTSPSPSSWRDGGGRPSSGGASASAGKASEAAEAVGDDDAPSIGAQPARRTLERCGTRLLSCKL